MAVKFKTDWDGMLAMLKRNYDGYHFCEEMTDIYNPFSLLNAFAQLNIRDFWFASGSPEYLLRLLAQSDENLDELTGKYYMPREFVDYKATVEKPLPMIYQSGYLTIKDFDKDFGSFLLDFPNKEVQQGFLSLAASGYFASKKDADGTVRSMVMSMRDGNTDRLKDILTAFLADIPYTARRKENERERERYFQYTFYLIFRLLGTYTVRAEHHSSQGRADCTAWWRPRNTSTSSSSSWTARRTRPWPRLRSGATQGRTERTDVRSYASGRPSPRRQAPSGTGKPSATPWASESAPAQRHALPHSTHAVTDRGI